MQLVGAGRSITRLTMPRHGHLSSAVIITLLLYIITNTIVVGTTSFPTATVRASPNTDTFPAFCTYTLVILTILLIVHSLLRTGPTSYTGTRRGPTFEGATAKVTTATFCVIAVDCYNCLVAAPIFLVIVVALVNCEQ